MKTRREIVKGEKVEHKGDLTIENDIGEGAELIITDGSLFVKGNIAQSAKIKLISNELSKGGVVFNENGGITVFGGVSSVYSVNGVTYVNGQRMTPETAPKPLKFVIEGSVLDKVTIESDASIQVKNNIGKDCYITTKHGGLEAKDIGKGTIIDVYGQIVARDISSTCKLTSQSYGLDARNVEDEVSIKTYKDITAAHYGKKCTLKSSSYGVKGTTVGEYSDIEAYKDVIMTKVGDNSSIISSSDGFQGGDVGKSVTIHTYKDIYLASADDNCRLTTTSYGITVSQYGNNNIKMHAYKDIIVGNLGNNCSLNSSSYGVKVSDAGDNLSIDAYKSISVNNVGRNASLNSHMYDVTTQNLSPGANISAYKDIVINGICPSDVKAVSSMGKVRKNGPIKELSFFASKPKENSSVSNDIPKHFICPISKKIMMSPVIFSEDGETYEATAIKKRLKELNYSAESISDVLSPNQVLTSMIGKYLEAHPEYLTKTTRSFNM